MVPEVLIGVGNQPRDKRHLSFQVLGNLAASVFVYNRGSFRSCAVLGTAQQPDGVPGFGQQSYRLAQPEHHQALGPAGLLSACRGLGNGNVFLSEAEFRDDPLLPLLAIVLFNFHFKIYFLGE